jgi:hypothetical protein
MVTNQNSTNVSFGPRRYPVTGSKGVQYWVTRFHDDLMVCTCPDFEYRIKEPVCGLKQSCKHIRAVLNGEAGKPRVRASVRPRPAVRRVTVSPAMRDRLSEYDV